MVRVGGLDCSKKDSITAGQWESGRLVHVANRRVGRCGAYHEAYLHVLASHLDSGVFDWFRGHGELGLRERLSAADVFSIFEARRYQIPAVADIRRARFSVMFRDASKPRSFTLRPSNFATFSRDDDSVPLHTWLERQKFVLPRQEETRPNEPWSLDYS